MKKLINLKRGREDISTFLIDYGDGENTGVEDNGKKKGKKGAQELEIKQTMAEEAGLIMPPSAMNIIS